MPAQLLSMFSISVQCTGEIFLPDDRKLLENVSSFFPVWVSFVLILKISYSKKIFFFNSPGALEIVHCGAGLS